MAPRRFFLSGPVVPGSEAAPVVLPLASDDVHHLRDVLRLRAEEEILVVEPGGRVLRVRLASIGDEVEAVVLAELPVSDEPHVVLFQGVAKGPKTDDVIQRAVEVGVRRVVPLLCERTVVRLDGQKAAERAVRWSKIAAEAAKQSQRTHVPDVAVPRSLREAEAELSGVDHLLVAWEEAGEIAPGIGEALRTAGVEADDSVGMVVGPEGGLAAGEVEWLRSLGAVPVTLGRTVLRTETAGVVATALVVYELGGLGGLGGRGCAQPRVDAGASPDRV